MNENPADPDLAALDALYQVGTPGEWTADGRFLDARNPERSWVAHVDYASGRGEANAALIAALHNAWPRLLALAREALERRRDEAQWPPAGHGECQAPLGGGKCLWPHCPGNDDGCPLL